MGETALRLVDRRVAALLDVTAGLLTEEVSPWQELRRHARDALRLDAKPPEIPVVNIVRA